MMCRGGKANMRRTDNKKNKLGGGCRRVGALGLELLLGSARAASRGNAGIEAGMRQHALHTSAVRERSVRRTRSSSRTPGVQLKFGVRVHAR
ncbi:uncharacterized [Tachysurus ichikawai]